MFSLELQCDEYTADAIQNRRLKLSNNKTIFVAWTIQVFKLQ